MKRSGMIHGTLLLAALGLCACTTPSPSSPRAPSPGPPAPPASPGGGTGSLYRPHPSNPLSPFGAPGLGLKVKQVIGESLGLDASGFGMGDPLMMRDQADDLAMLDLVIALEHAFQVDIPDTEVFGSGKRINPHLTGNDFVRLIREQQDKQKKQKKQKKAE